jgi:hypothetical protein
MKQAAATLVLLSGLFLWGPEPNPLALGTRIELSKVEGRIDLFTADVKGHRLFMGARENQTIEVLDVANGTRLRTIANVAEPQGLYYDAATNRLFVGCRKDGTTRVFDTITFDLFTLTFPGNVDNIRYDPHSHRIIVG